MARYTLGLDLGSNSVGWALIAQDGTIFDNRTPILAGARVFPAGLDMAKDKVGKPPGQERRLSRSQRRTIRRRRQRRRRLIDILAPAGLWPEPSCPRGHWVFGNHQDCRTCADSGACALREIACMEPYFLRAKGITDELTPYEFGRVLYHLCERRGFKSNKKVRTSEEEQKKAKSTQDAEKALRDRLGAENMTLGQFLARFATPSEKEEARKSAHKDPENKTEWIRNRARNPHYQHRA